MTDTFLGVTKLSNESPTMWKINNEINQNKNFKNENL